MADGEVDRWWYHGKDLDRRTFLMATTSLSTSGIDGGSLPPTARLRLTREYATSVLSSVTNKAV